MGVANANPLTNFDVKSGLSVKTFIIVLVCTKKNSKTIDVQKILQHTVHVKPLFSRVNNMSNKRKRNLDVAKTYYQFLQDAEEEERWVDEKIGVVKQTAIGKDLNAACVLLKRHEV